MAGNELKYTLLIGAKETASRVLQSVGGAFERLRQSGQSLKSVGAEMRVARENLDAMGQRGQAAIESVMAPTLALDQAMFELGPTMARVSNDVEGSLQRAKLASQDWAKAHSQSAGEYLAVTNRMLQSGKDEAGAHDAARIALRASSGAQSAAAGTADSLMAVYDQLGDKTADWRTELGSLGDQVVRTRQLYGSAFDPAALSDPLKDAAESAQKAKLPAAQLLTTLGALGQAGIKGGEAGAATRDLLTGLLNLEQQQGFALSRTSDGALDLGKTLENLHKTYGDFGDLPPEVAEKMTTAFGGGMRVVSALQAQGDRLQENYREVSGAMGTAEAAAAKFEGTTTASLQRLKNQTDAIKVTMGTGLEPALRGVGEDAEWAAKHIDELAKEHPGLVANAGRALVYGTAMAKVGAGAATAIGGVASLTGHVIDGTGKIVDFAKKAPAAVTSVRNFGAGALSAGRAAVSLGANAAAAGGSLLSTAVPGLLGAAKAGWAFTAALLANPITWVVLGVIAAAALIYTYWEPISTFFSGLWTEIKSAFDVSFVQGIATLLMNMSPITWIARGFNELIDYVFGINLASAGANIMSTLVSGIKRMAHAPIDAMRGVMQKVRNLLPFSPAKDGPLRDLHRVKLIETVADAVRPQPLVRAMSAAALAGMQALTPALPEAPQSAGFGGGSGAGGGGRAAQSIGSVTIQIQGHADQSVLEQLQQWVSNPDNAEKIAVAVARHTERQRRAEFS